MNPQTVQRTFVALAIVVALGTTSFSTRANAARPVDAARDQSTLPISASAQYGKLPLSFAANAGQVDSSVRFQTGGSSGTLSFEANGVLLALTPGPSTAGGRGELAGRDALSPTRWEKGLGIESVPAITLNLYFRGVNPNARIDGADQLPGMANYFIGDDPSQWRTNVPTYAGVVYHDLYPGVDLEYAGHTGLLKGSYTVAAGVDPAIIRWQYSGADSLALDGATGNLTISVSDGVTLTEQAPIAWQTRNGAQTPVTVGYQLGADGVAQFVAGAYDRSLPLTIDPALTYLTYLGGSGTDTSTGIAVDGDGNAYVVGYTTGGSFPTTPGVPQPKYGGGTSDVFVSKLNSTGTALVYSTFLGGKGSDLGDAITVDKAGNAYIIGIAQDGFPTTKGALQTKFGGNYDAFVTELNPAGNALVYSTYLGGKGDDRGYGIALDGSGNAFVTGFTTGSFPTTASAYQVKAGGGEDAFVSELNPTGTALLYSSYLGGSGQDYAYKIALDSSGNAYVTGFTGGKFPTTTGAFQTKFGGGPLNAFVSKLNLAASGAASLIYSTYVGGSGTDQGFGIAVDADGNAYITGLTSSKNFPTTANVYQTKFGGVADAFVTILNPSGTGLVASTYLGGSGADYGTAIALDANRNVYVVGTTTGNFPTTPDAFQTTYGGGPEDGFITVFSAGPSPAADHFSATMGKARLTNNGDQMTGFSAPIPFCLKTGLEAPILTHFTCSTYVGAGGDDAASSVAPIKSGGICLAINTSSPDLPVTPNSIQITLRGIENVAIACFQLGQSASVKPPCPKIVVLEPLVRRALIGEPLFVRRVTATSSNGNAIFTFEITSGMLPPGLTLDPSTGVISGTPSTRGIYDFTVKATDPQGCSASTASSLTTLTRITLDTSLLPDADLNQPYTQTFTASGGIAPYYYFVDGSLPPGLTLNPDTGELSGTPTQAGMFNFTIVALDKWPDYAGRNDYTLTVVAPGK